MDDTGRVPKSVASHDEVEELLTSFGAVKHLETSTPKHLAERMAGLARMTRDVIIQAYGEESEGGTLHGQLAAFEETLIPGLTVSQFADMYAQTIAYGLFAARIGWPGEGQFGRMNAAWLLPKTNPFLRSLFVHMAGPDLPDNIAWLVDDLAQLLAYTEMSAILEDFGKKTRKEDPVVHFYETFLQHYDPKTREIRGVYYTPEPVVNYIVRAVDSILQRSHGRSLGVADPETVILDPATGTGTFLYALIRVVFARLEDRGQSGAWSDYVARHLLPRLFGFELLMAPYAVGHLKLGIELQNLGYDFDADQRLGVYLTNTLEEAIKKSEALFAQFISDEANAAARIKVVEPIMVVIGNPPYSRHSANHGKWIGDLVRDYYQVDGQPLGEKNPKWLQNDYVKFIRFGQWRIDQTGRGILAFITSHGYLDDPTFRGMRASLIKSFDDIYILDLHGNQNKGEVAPDGSPDKNVFDIRQGVCIGIFVKHGKGGKVRHTSLWGSREAKYERLEEWDIDSTPWEELPADGPSYFLVPRDTTLGPEYEIGHPLPDIFPLHASTVTTARNKFAIDYDRAVLEKRLEDFVDTKKSDEDIRSKYGLKDVSYWRVAEARKAVSTMSRDDLMAVIKPYCYRPFDDRYVAYHPAISERLRSDVMVHMQYPNVALLSHRPHSTPAEFTFAFCTRKIADQCVAANKSVGGGNSYEFPLYRYSIQSPKSAQGLLQDFVNDSAREPNLGQSFLEDIKDKLGLALRDKADHGSGTIDAFDVWGYVYGMLHCPTYRSRYAEFLKRGFARIPVTSDRDQFFTISTKGREIAGVHLLEAAVVEAVISKFPVSGSAMVSKVLYSGADQRLYINDEQFFDAVTAPIWEFAIGGYRVLERWLGDRQGLVLSYSDIRSFQRVVAALVETQRLMMEIDEAIPTWPVV